MKTVTTKCSCGKAGTVVSVSPRTRFRCHCTKCQSVYKSAYADALVFRRGQVQLIDYEAIDWIRTMKPSPLIRGLCRSCEQPVLAHLYGVFSIVPSRTASDLDLPQIECDVFYGTRAADLNDEVPKYVNALTTYMGLTVPFTKVLLMPGRSLGMA